MEIRFYLDFLNMRYVLESENFTLLKKNWGDNFNKKWYKVIIFNVYLVGW